MAGRRGRWGAAGLLLAALASGCSAPAPPTGGSPAAAGDEQQLRVRFDNIRAALRAADADRLWSLLDGQSQAEAERVAAALRSAYDRADLAGRAKYETDWGLAAAELAGLTGKGLLRSKRFRDRHHEAAAGTFDGVAVQGDSATVYYRDAEGDREKLLLVRRGGEWRLWLRMPRVSPP
jgi:hypothetical protein